ncbi:MAG: hypothetical protein AAB947_00950 [Patescibacteria group bacterium]
MVKISHKRGVTQEQIMEVLLGMDERIVSMNERMATKDDLRNYATKNDLSEFKKVLLNMNERMATKDDLRNYATKNDLEKFKDDILEEIRPIARAVNRDAETIINHGKRIVVLERRSEMATR